MTEDRNNLPELPTGWVYASLEEISENIVDCPHSTPKFASEGKYCIDTTCIKPGEIVFDKARFVSLETYHERTKRLIPKAGDILFSREGTIGTAVVVPENIELCLGQRMMMFRAASCIIPTYYIWALISPVFENQWKPKVIGTTSPHVNIRDLKIMVLPIPPLNEQRRIVAKIEALKARSQRVKEELEAIAPLLDQFRQSVLAAAFRGDLTADWREKNPDVEPASALLERIRVERRRRWEEVELEKMKARGKTPKDDDWKAKYKEPKSLEDIPINYPDSWTWARAEEVCDFITKGTTPAANKMFEQSGDIPFIKVYNLTNRGFLDFSINPTFISKEVHNGELARSKVFPGDILMNIVGPPLGKVAIVPDDYKEWNMNQAIAVYRAMPGIENRLLAYCLLSTQILSTAVHAAKATAGQFNLTLEICRDLPLPIPPTSEQQQIVAMIDRCFAAADLIAEQVANAGSQNDVLNQSILAKAFRGELVPQDPNDEPTSVLLERIRAEREKLDTKKKAKGKTQKKSRKAKPEAPEPEQLSLPGFE